MAYFISKHEVECPFCKAINSQEDWYPDQDEETEVECSRCDKTFTISASYSISITTFCGGIKDDQCEYERYIIGDDTKTSDGKVYVKCKNCDETRFIEEEKLKK